MAWQFFREKAFQRLREIYRANRVEEANRIDETPHRRRLDCYSLHSRHDRDDSPLVEFANGQVTLTIVAPPGTVSIAIRPPC